MYKKILLAGLFIGVAVVIVFGVLFVNEAANPSNTPENQRAQEQAITEAQAFTPEDENCSEELTSAIHTDTGAEFVFPTNCLAPGWESNE